jgi:hypothetical protein
MLKLIRWCRKTIEALKCVQVEQIDLKYQERECLEFEQKVSCPSGSPSELIGAPRYL